VPDVGFMRLPRSPLTVLALAAALGVPATAVAQLGLPQLPLPVTVPDPVDVISQGDVGGLLDDVTGALPAPIGDTVDDVLGGSLGELPSGTVDDLLGSIGVAGLDGAPGAPGTPGVTVLPDGTILVDSRPPVTGVKVLSKTREVGRTGRLRLQISSDEPSIIALGGTIRPGITRKVHGHRLRHHSRKPIRLPSAVLSYRKAGPLKVAIQLSRKSQRNLRRGYNARVSLALLALDVARNQQRRTVKRIVRH
jgi:hypothetical protein